MTMSMQRIQVEVAIKDLPEVKIDGSVSKIGEGGFGEVFADDTKVYKLVINTSYAQMAQDMLTRESKVLQNLKHKNIVQFLTASKGVLVLEKIEGEDLATAVVNKKVIDKKQVYRDVAAALVYLHKNSIVNGDVNPWNVMLDKNGVSKMIDFGTANRSNVPFGWQGFYGGSSPEQVLGLPRSASMDVFGLLEIASVLEKTERFIPNMFGKISQEQLEQKRDNNKLRAFHLRVTASRLGQEYSKKLKDFFTINAQEAAKIDHDAIWRAFKAIKSVALNRPFPQDDLGKKLFERIGQLDPRQRPTAKEILEDPYLSVPQKEAKKTTYL